MLFKNSAKPQNMIALKNEFIILLYRVQVELVVRLNNLWEWIEVPGWAVLTTQGIIKLTLDEIHDQWSTTEIK